MTCKVADCTDKPKALKKQYRKLFVRDRSFFGDGPIESPKMKRSPILKHRKELENELTAIEAEENLALVKEQNIQPHVGSVSGKPSSSNRAEPSRKQKRKPAIIISPTLWGGVHALNQFRKKHDEDSIMSSDEEARPNDNMEFVEPIEPVALRESDKGSGPIRGSQEAVVNTEGHSPTFVDVTGIESELQGCHEEWNFSSQEPSPHNCQNNTDCSNSAPLCQVSLKNEKKRLADQMPLRLNPYVRLERLVLSHPHVVLPPSIVQPLTEDESDDASLNSSDLDLTEAADLIPYFKKKNRRNDLKSYSNTKMNSDKRKVKQHNSLSKSYLKSSQTSMDKSDDKEETFKQANLNEAKILNKEESFNKVNRKSKCERDERESPMHKHEDPNKGQRKQQEHETSRDDTKTCSDACDDKMAMTSQNDTVTGKNPKLKIQPKLSTCGNIQESQEGNKDALEASQSPKSPLVNSSSNDTSDSSLYNNVLSAADLIPYIRKPRLPLCSSAKQTASAAENTESAERNCKEGKYSASPKSTAQKWLLKQIVPSKNNEVFKKMDSENASESSSPLNLLEQAFVGNEAEIVSQDIFLSPPEACAKEVLKEGRSGDDVLPVSSYKHCENNCEVLPAGQDLFSTSQSDNAEKYSKTTVSSSLVSSDSETISKVSTVTKRRRESRLKLKLRSPKKVQVQTEELHSKRSSPVCVENSSNFTPNPCSEEASISDQSGTEDLGWTLVTPDNLEFNDKPLEQTSNEPEAVAPDPSNADSPIIERSSASSPSITDDSVTSWKTLENNLEKKKKALKKKNLEKKKKVLKINNSEKQKKALKWHNKKVNNLRMQTYVDTPILKIQVVGKKIVLLEESSLKETQEKLKRRCKESKPEELTFDRIREIILTEELREREEKKVEQDVNAVRRENKERKEKASNTPVKQNKEVATDAIPKGKKKLKEVEEMSQNKKSEKKGVKDRFEERETVIEVVDDSCSESGCTGTQQRNTSRQKEMENEKMVPHDDGSQLDQDKVVPDMDCLDQKDERKKKKKKKRQEEEDLVNEIQQAVTLGELDASSEGKKKKRRKDKYHTEEAVFEQVPIEDTDTVNCSPHTEHKPKKRKRREKYLSDAAVEEETHQIKINSENDIEVEILSDTKKKKRKEEIMVADFQKPLSMSDIVEDESTKHRKKQKKKKKYEEEEIVSANVSLVVQGEETSLTVKKKTKQKNYQEGTEDNAGDELGEDLRKTEKRKGKKQRAEGKTDGMEEISEKARGEGSKLMKEKRNIEMCELQIESVEEALREADSAEVVSTRKEKKKKKKDRIQAETVEEALVEDVEADPTEEAGARKKKKKKKDRIQAEIVEEALLKDGEVDPTEEAGARKKRKKKKDRIQAEIVEEALLKDGEVDPTEEAGARKKKKKKDRIQAEIVEEALVEDVEVDPTEEAGARKKKKKDRIQAEIVEEALVEDVKEDPNEEADTKKQKKKKGKIQPEILEEALVEGDPLEEAATGSKKNRKRDKCAEGGMPSNDFPSEDPSTDFVPNKTKKKKKEKYPDESTPIEDKPLEYPSEEFTLKAKKKLKKEKFLQGICHAENTPEDMFSQEVTKKKKKKKKNVKNDDEGDVDLPLREAGREGKNKMREHKHEEERVVQEGISHEEPAEEIFNEKRKKKKKKKNRLREEGILLSDIAEVASFIAETDCLSCSTPNNIKEMNVEHANIDVSRSQDEEISNDETSCFGTPMLRVKSKLTKNEQQTSKASESEVQPEELSDCFVQKSKVEKKKRKKGEKQLNMQERHHSEASKPANNPPEITNVEESSCLDESSLLSDPSSHSCGQEKATVSESIKNLKSDKKEASKRKRKRETTPRNQSIVEEVVAPIGSSVAESSSNNDIEIFRSLPESERNLSSPVQAVKKRKLSEMDLPVCNKEQTTVTSSPALKVDDSASPWDRLSRDSNGSFTQTNDWIDPNVIITTNEKATPPSSENSNYSRDPSEHDLFSQEGLNEVDQEVVNESSHPDQEPDQNILELEDSNSPVPAPANDQETGIPVARNSLDARGRLSPEINPWSCIKKRPSIVNGNKCTRCREAFKSVVAMMKHVCKGVPSKKNLPPPDVRAKFQCDSCDRRYIQKCHLQHHVRARHLMLKPYKCSECPMDFSEKQTMILHLRWHSNLKPYECDKCGCAFVSRSHLHSHLKGFHKLIPRYPCSYCRFEYFSEQDLKAHVEDIHSRRTITVVKEIDGKRKI